MANSGIPLANFTTAGELLKFLRRRARLSQRELSIATGYSESHLSRIESGDRPLDRTSLLALFVPALHIEDEPQVIDRLLALCTATLSGSAETPAAAAVLEEPPILPALRHRLPAQLTSFIGRQEEAAELHTLLALRENRLITLTGAGGCGKTRLALHVGEAAKNNYAHGAWLVELAPLGDPELLAQHVADALHLGGSADVPPRSRLIDFLSSRQVLLILDNCEHLVAAAVELAAALLRTCPELQILATSRERLGLPGEINFLVQPLALPPVQQGVLPARGAVADYDAIRLFVDRAGRALRTFALTDRNAPAVARICQRLDGIPLGIELAAVWLTVLAPEQIAARLEHDFELLMENSRTTLPRHRTLHAATEWSYNLLTAEEQVLLRRLSIFAGGWSLEAAEAIMADKDSTQVLKLLNSLVNKSLVTAEHPPESEVRYRLLEPIREHLRDKLAAEGEMKELRDRHLAFYVSLVEQAEPKLRTAMQQAWLARLDQEQENIRTALHWSLTHNRLEDGLRLVGALGRFWELRFNLVEGRRWCEAMLAAVDSGDRPVQNRLRAKALFTAGLLGCYLNDIERSQQQLADSLRFYLELGDDAGAGAVLCFTAINYSFTDDAQQAIATFHEALRYSQRAEDAWWIAENMH